MLRTSTLAVVVGLALTQGCAPRSAAVDPNDPVITATIDSLLQLAMAGAARVDADQVLGGAADSLTFVSGDIILSGLEPIRERFRRTYSHLQKQDQTLIEKRIRVLSPDVAVAIVTAEGTYTDQAGWTSPPVGLGTSIVFVRQNGQWRAQHAHQSVAP